MTAVIRDYVVVTALLSAEHHGKRGVVVGVRHQYNRPTTYDVLLDGTAEVITTLYCAPLGKHKLLESVGTGAYYPDSSRFIQPKILVDLLDWGVLVEHSGTYFRVKA